MATKYRKVRNDPLTWNVMLECRVDGVTLQLIEYPNVSNMHFEVCWEGHNSTTSDYFSNVEGDKARARYEELRGKLAFKCVTCGADIEASDNGVCELCDAQGHIDNAMED